MRPIGERLETGTVVYVLDGPSNVLAEATVVEPL
jgi:hypothetical protein